MATLHGLTEKTDNELASLVGTADRTGPHGQAQTAFEQLHSRHAGIVLAVITRMIKQRNASLASDISQAVWTKVWQSTGTQFVDGNFRAWLLTIARNQALDELRRKQPAALSPLAEPTAAAPDDDERIPALRDCIGRLDADRRRVMELWLEQKSHDEISRELHIEPGTSMSRLSRAKDLIKKCIEAKNLT